MARNLWLWALAGVLASIGAPASAEDYPACTKIDSPLAYNQCLATHGPPAHATRAAAASDEGARPQGAGRAPAGAEVQISQRRNGRMVMEFTVGGATGASRKHKQAH